MSRLELLVLFHPLLIVIVAGFTILVITGCVRVTHRLPPLESEVRLITGCQLIEKQIRGFKDKGFEDGEIPEDLRQSGEYCMEREARPSAPLAVWIPSPFEAKCALVQKLKRQFGDGEIPAELTQAEEICREAGL